MLGTCFSAGDLQAEVANWIKTKLGMNLQTGSSAFVRSVEEKYRVVELSVVREDMAEVSLSDPLLANYLASFWPAVHNVRQDQASPCVCLIVVKFLTTGHILAYTDMDWQKKLVILYQELQFSQSVPLQTCARDMVMLSTPSLQQFTLARAVVLSLSTVEDIKIDPTGHNQDRKVFRTVQVIYTKKVMELMIIIYQEYGQSFLQMERRKVFSENENDNAFLGMMAGQSRQVVDQTILTTRLVVRFFQINGGRTLDDLMSESKQLQVNMERIGNTEERRQVGVEEFLQLKNHLLRRFGHSILMRFACELSIKCLVDSGEASLVNRCAEPQDKRWMMEWLGDRLGGVRAKFGGGVAVSSLARSIVEYGAAQAQTRTAAETSFGSWEAGQLRQNINTVKKLLRSNKDCMAAYHSLVAIKQYFHSNMMEETIHSDRGQGKMVAECCHKGLALLGISHYSLKGEFDRGETSFRAGLRGKLGEVEQLLPAGVSHTSFELYQKILLSNDIEVNPGPPW